MLTKLSDVGSTPTFSATKNYATILMLDRTCYVISSRCFALNQDKNIEPQPLS